jgi:hypothetical protein
MGTRKPRTPQRKTTPQDEAERTTRRTRDRDGVEMQRITVWLPNDVARALRHYAVDTDATLAGAIEQILRERLKL